MAGRSQLIIGLLDTVGSAIAGPSLPLNGRKFQLGTGGKANQQDFLPIELAIQGTGITSGATIKIEVSNDGTSWTQWGSDMVYNKAGSQSHKRVGKLVNVYIRARVSSWTDGTYTGYILI